MKNKTDITIILDRSGSMDAIKTDTIGGFNSFLREQQKVSDEAVLSLVQFDDQYETVYSDKDIQAAEPLNDETFQPRGTTALYDAIGRTINTTGQRLAALPEGERPNQVIFVIFTDGYENASREFDAKQIGEMIRHQKEVYSWEFLFIGANQDAILSAEQIGIASNKALTFAANAGGTRNAMKMVAEKIQFSRLAPQDFALEFNEEDREAQRKADKNQE
ncbi:MAG: VWA domain-containing protein [Pyrinomonadaceae bacterium]